jgi:AhpD family alkylhydroperoxidase
MGRSEVYQEMRDTLGTAPSSFDRVPDEFIDAEWDLVKRVQFGETLIPNKYKELIGLAVAAATRCRYGILLHSEIAAANGATDAELAEAVFHAKLVSGWGLHVAGLGADYDQFAEDVQTAVAFLRSWRSEGASAVGTPASALNGRRTMSDANKDLVRRHQDAWNRGDLDALAGILAPNWVSNSWPEDLPRSAEGLQEVYQHLYTVFSAIDYRTEVLIGEGDWVAQRLTGSFTVRGDEPVGAASSVRRFEAGGVSMYRIADGRIVEHWAFADELGSLQGLGAEIPPDWVVVRHRTS